MTTASEDLFNSLYNGGASPLADAVEERIYPVRLPQGDPAVTHERVPCIVYRRISTAMPANSHLSWGGLAMYRWQFDCWATTHYQAEALGESLRAALTQAPIDAQSVTVHDADAGPDRSLWRVIVEAYTWRDEEA